MRAIRWCWGLSALFLLMRAAWDLRAHSLALAIVVLVGSAGWWLVEQSHVRGCRAGAIAGIALAVVLTLERFSPGGWLLFLLIWSSALSGAVLVASLLRVKAIAILTAPLGLLLMFGSMRPYYTEWFTLLPARTEVDGKPTGGYVHYDRGRTGSVAIVTIRGARVESCWTNEDQPHVRLCGDGWIAPAFPLVAIGDVNPPCFVFGEIPDPNRPDPPERNLVIGPRLVEFTANNRRRVRATW